MIADLEPYSAMKDSGVEWLGQVPEHWRLERGKNLFTKVERPVCETDEVVTCFRDGTVTLRKNRRTQGFTESLKEIGYQGIRRGDLVIHAMDAFAGAVGVSDSDGKGTPVYAVCRPEPNADADYHALVIREMARNRWILALATGIRERSTDFRFGTYANQRVPLPPLPEQAAIVRYLDYVDRRVQRLVRAKRKLIALLTEQKQATIHRAVTRGLDHDVPLKESGIEWLDEVPEHWEVVLNQRIFKENIRPHNDQLETPLSLSQRDGLIATTDMKERSLQTSTYDNWKVVHPEDIVVNRFKAHLGVFFASTLRGIVSFHYGVFEPRRKMVPKYFEHLYHTAPYRTIYAGRSNGMTVGLQNLSNQNFYNVKSVVPPLAEQVAIVEYLEKASADINAAVSRADNEIELLNEYRTRLITDVVTGKLDVREAAAAVPEVDLRDVEDELDDLDTDSEADLEDLDTITEEVGE